MPTTNYLNFDLQIQHNTDDEYSVAVSSPAGEPARLRFKKSELLPTENSPDVNLDNYISPPKTSNRHLIFLEAEGLKNKLVPAISKPLPYEQARDFGRKLFSTIFRDGLRTAFDKSVVHAENQKAYLRIRLNLTDAPELAVLPWEYLCNEKDLFFAKNRRTSLTRYLNQDESVEELLVSDSPLRVPVVISMPLNQNRLDVDAEWNSIKNAFRELEESKQRKFCINSLYRQISILLY